MRKGKDGKMYSVSGNGKVSKGGWKGRRKRRRTRMSGKGEWEGKICLVQKRGG